MIHDQGVEQIHDAYQPSLNIVCAVTPSVPLVAHFSIFVGRTRQSMRDGESGQSNMFHGLDLID